jgi:hypothetical protein
MNTFIRLPHKVETLLRSWITNDFFIILYQKFMRTFLLKFVFICAPFFIIAQPQPYTIVKQNRSITLTSKSDTIIFQEYRKVNRKESERVVTINKEDYKFIVKDTKHGKIQDVVDASGQRMATVLLGGENPNSIVFPDGKQLKWQRTGKTSWAYYYEGTEVVKSFYYLEEESKKFVVQKYDVAALTSVVLPAISLEYGTKKSRSVSSRKSQQRTFGAMIGIAAALALLRLGTAYD